MAGIPMTFYFILMWNIRRVAHCLHKVEHACTNSKYLQCTYSCRYIALFLFSLTDMILETFLIVTRWTLKYLATFCSLPKINFRFWLPCLTLNNSLETIRFLWTSVHSFFSLRLGRGSLPQILLSDSIAKIIEWILELYNFMAFQSNIWTSRTLLQALQLCINVLKQL